MRVKGLSKILSREAANDLDLFSALFEIQKVHNYENISKDIYAAKNGTKTFVLTNFEDGLALVDVIPSGNVKIEMLKRNSIKKLLEIKKGIVVPLDDSIAGSALPTGPQ